MDALTARRLATMTGDFYARTAASFSATRSYAWPGFERVFRESALVSRLKDGPVSVLDLACGNLRFERFLGESLGLAGRDDTPLHVHAYDSCDDMVRGVDVDGVRVSYRHLDIAEALFAEGGLDAALGVRGCDLAVSFGFMHHVALPEHRAQVLDSLISCVAEHGCVAVSFWQMSKSSRLLEKARATTEALIPKLNLEGLAAGDYLLGWQGSTDVVRYCHDFSEQEIDALAEQVVSRAHEVARFSADGSSGDLNRYLVLRRN